jgi:hypothetical protein
MIEGFWILEIRVPQYTTGGVAVFTKGKVYGGDNAFTWIGSYSTDGRIIKGRVNVHNFDSSVQSVLGVSGDYEMHFSGDVRGDVITGTAMIANQPQHSIPIRFTKRADI